MSGQWRRGGGDVLGPRTAVEGRLEDPCRQNHLILGGVVVSVHRGRGHAPPARQEVNKGYQGSGRAGRSEGEPGGEEDKGCSPVHSDTQENLEQNIPQSSQTHGEP